VVDVREAAEWATGHIAGARLVPLELLRTMPKATLKASPVLFVCAAGVRSQTAARLASQVGIETIFSLSGGTRAWVKAGLELVHPVNIAV